MNGIIKAAFKLNTLKVLGNSVRNNLPSLSKRQFTRNIWHMCDNRNDESLVRNLKVKSPSTLCDCGCGIHGVHTKGERELVEFLTEEIVLERKAQKGKAIPSEIDGFQIKLDGAEMHLTKAGEKETINISFNVNHTVDAAEEANIDPNMDKPDFADMKSQPQFEVDIVHGKTTLSFTCSFINDEQNTDEKLDDIFGIDEITLFEGEWNDKTYAVAGDVLDGYLYDLLMNLLEEKGISNEFVQKLSELSTNYEHSIYVGLLEGLSKFTTEVRVADRINRYENDRLQNTN